MAFLNEVSFPSQLENILFVVLVSTLLGGARKIQYDCISFHLLILLVFHLTSLVFLGKEADSLRCLFEFSMDQLLTFLDRGQSLHHNNKYFIQDLQKL